LRLCMLMLWLLLSSVLVLTAILPLALMLRTVLVITAASAASAKCLFDHVSYIRSIKRVIF